jgi:geranylgeranyl diphosphate synthase type II
MAAIEPVDGVQPLLTEYGNRALRAVLDAVPVHEPRRELYDLVLAHLRAGGKRLRPAIVLATCGALGGDVRRAVPLAAPVELLHAAFLVHDDIEDNSPRRRGRPALHEAHGLPLALNAGDALASLAVREIGRAARAYGEQGVAAAEEFQDVVLWTIEGQALELGWRAHLGDATDAAYLNVVLRKTARYTVILPLRLGALAATGVLPRRGRFERFGFYLGALFQLRDDMRNLWPKGETNGQNVGTDIVEGKLTLMVSYVLTVAPPSVRGELVEILGAAADGEQVTWAIRTLEEYGGREHAQMCAHALADAAGKAFDTAFAGVRSSRDLMLLADLPRYMLES